MNGEISVKEESNMLYKEQEYNKKNRCCLEAEESVEKMSTRQGSIEMEIEKCTKSLVGLTKIVENLSTRLVPILSEDCVARNSTDQSEKSQCCNIARILSSFNREIAASVEKIEEIMERIEL
jgi:hypothetical protein